MFPIRIPLLLALVFVGWPQERPKEKQRMESTTIFSLLSVNNRPCPSEERLAKWGLVKLDGEARSLIDQSGELHVSYDASDKKMFLRFWPSPRNTSSATVLTALLNNARNTSVLVESPDEISVQLREDSWLRFSLADGRWVGTDAESTCK